MNAHILPLSCSTSRWVYIITKTKYMPRISYFAQGALVWTSGLPSPAGEGFAQGARVGAMGPGGNLEVSGRTGGILDDVLAPPLLAVVAHGAAVPPAAASPAVAQGALVPDSAGGCCGLVDGADGLD